MLFKKDKHTVSTPGEAREMIESRLKQLAKYYGDSFQKYTNSLIAYDCWAEKDHLLTGPAFVHDEQTAALWMEVIRDFGKKNKTGSWFEHRLQEIFAERKS